MITLEFQIKNTKKKKKIGSLHWLRILLYTVILNVMFLYECSVGLSSIVCEWPHRYIHPLVTFRSPSV